MSKVGRDSGIELLRIVAMCAIIASHFAGETHFRDGLSGCDLFVANFLTFGSRIAVNVFIIISSWFLLDMPFSAERPIKLYVSLFCCTVPLTIFGLLFADTVGLDKVLAGLLPFSFRSAWYITAYIAFLFLVPFLQGVRFLSQAKHRLLSVLVVVLVSYTASIPGTNAYDFPADLLWFPCVFVIVSYIKRFWQIDNIRRVPIYLLLAVSMYLPIVLVETVAKDPRLIAWADLYCASIKTIPNFAIAFLVFASFLSFHGFNNNVVNRVAKTVLWVYVIHTAPLYSDIQWKCVCQLLPCKTDGVASVVLCVVSTVAMVFVVSGIIGVLLKYGIVRFVNRMYTVNRLIEGVDRLYDRPDVVQQKGS